MFNMSVLNLSAVSGHRRDRRSAPGSPVVCALALLLCLPPAESQAWGSSRSMQTGVKAMTEPRAEGVVAGRSAAIMGEPRRGRGAVRGPQARPPRSGGTAGEFLPALPTSSRPLFLPPYSLPGHDLSLSLYCPLSLPLSLSSSLSFLFRSRSSLVPPGLRVSRLLRLPALPPAPSRCVTRSPWLTDCHVALT